MHIHTVTPEYFVQWDRRTLFHQEQMDRHQYSTECIHKQMHTHTLVVAGRGMCAYKLDVVLVQCREGTGTRERKGSEREKAMKG